MNFRRIAAFVFAVLLFTVAQGCSAPTPYSYNGSCFSQCPWNSTLVTYLNSSSLTCSTTCSPGYYRDDSTKNCSSTCPTTPIVTYYDNVYNRCVQSCSTGPSYFAYTTNNTCVQYCPSPTWAVETLGVCVNVCPYGTYYQIDNSERTCVQQCYPNYYADLNKSCVSAAGCPSTPVTYFGDDLTGLCVAKCPVSAGTFADNATQKCLFHCPLGKFADSTTQQCVTVCPILPSYFGSNITRNCLLYCNAGEFADTALRQCTRVCSVGFGDYSTRRCVSTCPFSQSTFADPLSKLCVAICPSNYYANNATRSCVTAINCASNTFGNPVTQQCVAQGSCNTGFYIDTASGLCVVRCSTWGNPINGFCEPSCPWNPPIYTYYMDGSTNNCVQTCPVNPRTFGDNSSRSCVQTCPTGSIGSPLTMVCVQTCPSGFFANTQTYICVANCTQNSSSVLYFFQPNLTCISSCPLYYYADSASLSCVSICSNNTFAYGPNRTCLSSCPDGYFGDSYSQSCATSCPVQNGQYADPSTHLCVSSCPTTPDYYGQNINDGNNTCVSGCVVSGHFADPLTRTCLANCNITAGYYGYLTNGRCYQRCPVGYGNPITKLCTSVCPKFPRFFYGDNLTATCVLGCPGQTYGDPNNNLCVTALNCSTGLFGDDITGLCVSLCSKLLNLYGDPVINKCVPVCTYPYYSDPTTRRCSLNCSTTGSAMLFKDAASKACVTKCSSLPDLYNDPNSMTCQYNCTNGYFAFAYGSSRTCVQMCPSTPPYLADLQNGVCVTKCANDTYKFTNNTFRGCLYYCPPQVFNSSLTMNLFADNTTWSCVQTCPYGYYAFLHPTNATIRICVRYCPMVGSTYYFAEDNSRTCITSCPMLVYGSYGDQIDFRCVVSCSRFQYRDNSSSLCVYHCPNGTFANNVTWNCSGWCSEGYFAESINNTCVRACSINLYAYNKLCVSQCPNGTYFYNDNKTWTCVQRCPSYPDYYADETYLACVFKCYPGTFADTSTRMCLLPINCSSPTIADPTSGRCAFQCSKVPMYFLTVVTNLCGTTCSNGQFAYNNTNMCLDACPAPYFGVNSTVNFYCTLYCPPLQYMWVNLTTRMCITNCPVGLYRDNFTMSCVSVCPDYTYANVSNNLCVSSCFPLYASNFNKSCVAVCPNNTTASNSTYSCQSQCDYGNYTLNNVCYNSCIEPYFADNLTRKCVLNCPVNLLTFADPLTKKCASLCQSGQYAFLSNRTCISSCPVTHYKELTLLLCLDVCLQGYFSDNDTRTCVTNCSASASNSSSYNYSDPTTKTCVQVCPSNPDLYGFNYQCLTQCPNGTYAQNFTRICVAICPNVSIIYLNQSWADVLTRRCIAVCSALSYSYSNTTNNVCVNNCPPGIYASIVGQACLAVCPPGFFAYNTTWTCVYQCPPGQWADSTLRICMPNCTYNSSLFSDDSTNTCVQKCPAEPDLYAEPINQTCVLSCPPNYYSYNATRRCVTDCVFPYFADTYNLDCVLKCPLSQLTYADSILRKCTPSCVNHTLANGTLIQYYKDNATLACVTACPQFPQKFYGYNTTNTCVQQCPSGTYGDNDTNLCLDKCIFKDPKFTWMDRSNYFCVTVCGYGYYADNKTGACQLTCTNGTFADSSTRRCVISCPVNPVSYAAVIGGVGLCIYNCPNGTFSSEVSISCVTSCPTLPSVYYTYSPTNACVKDCIYPYFADLSLKACTTTCKQGFYGNLTTKICQVCQVQCVTCQGYLVCTSCLIGFFLYENTCVISCPSYPVMYYAEKQSGVCFKSCPYPFFGEPSTQLCQLLCPAQKYQNIATGICTTCPTGCITCDSLGCYTCSSGYTFLVSALTCNKNCNSTAIYYYNSACYTACPKGSYLSYDLVNCLNCSSPCATCFGTSGNCTSCIGSYYYLGQCQAACPANFFVDSNLNCVACTSNPQRCTLAPLSYKVFPFTSNYQMRAFVVFNRAVNLTLSQFASTVQISYDGQSLKTSQFTASIYNQTTFLVIFSSDISLNEKSLSFYFAPGSISDQYGNILTVVTVTQNVTGSAGVNAQVSQINTKLKSGTQVITYILLIVLALFFIKGGYPALISIQVLQIFYMHIFLYTDPLPYLEYHFLDTLKYFHLLFMPQIFPSIGITDTFYLLFSQDISFLSNCPIIILFAFIIVAYLIVKALSSKKVMANKALRRTFKHIRKYRMRYGIIHDAFWICYLYALFISLLQFKVGGFGSTMAIVNMLLAIVTFGILTAFTGFLIYLGYKYRKQPQKIPTKYISLALQPSTFPMEIPIRYGRKYLLALALLLSTLQSQASVMLMVNSVFLIFYLCYQPASSPVTNKVCIIIQMGYIILEGLFIGYDKLVTKDTNSQLGFSIAMIVVEGLVILLVLAWAFYRLVLVIRETDSWKHIYKRLTVNTDPEYLKEQQRRKDLQYDFGSVQNKSQDQRTEHHFQKDSAKKGSLDQKFNIFDQNHDEDEKLQHENKPISINKLNKGVSRPASAQSSDIIPLKSQSSEDKAFPFKKSSRSWRNRGDKQHLKINQASESDSIEEVIIQRQAQVSNGRIVVDPLQERKVVWEDIDFDDNQL